MNSMTEVHSIINNPKEKSMRESRIFYVDIPTAEAIGDPDGAYKNVATFHTKKEAIEFAKREFGADNQGRVQLVTG
jgi:hypothetical protein